MRQATTESFERLAVDHIMIVDPDSGQIDGEKPTGVQNRRETIREERPTEQKRWIKGGRWQLDPVQQLRDEIPDRKTN